MTENCTTTHCNRQDWSTIYEGWQREDLKYYWRDKQVNFVPWDSDLSNVHADQLRKALKLEHRYNRKRKALADKYVNEP